MKISRREIKSILYLSLTSIVLTFFIAKIGFIIYQNNYHSGLEIWNRWDTKHYLNIAKYGYQYSYKDPLTITFFPLYPWFIRLVSTHFKDYLISALFITNLSFVVTLIFFYRLVRKDFNKTVAWRTIFFFSIFPTAYFLHAGYTESLFLMFIFMAFYFAREEKWLFAAATGIFASLTRINGLILIPAFLVEYIAVRKFNLRKVKLNILWILLIAIGFIYYLYINYQIFDNPFQFGIIIKELTWEHLSFPWVGLIDAVNRFFRYQSADWMIEGFFVILFWLFSLVLLIYSLKKIRPSYSVFAWLNFILMTITSIWSGLPRYTLMFFPIFIVLALLGESHAKNYFITVFSLLLQSIFLILFVQGHWAF